MHRYSEDYYAVRKEGTRSSAEVIVPLVLEVVKARSVIDVGCGTGEWLSVFKEHGVEDIWGVDGEYVNIKTLAIPEERFIPYDLKRPYRIDRAFDLVVSLEVAEHLPADCAETLVDSLTGLGSVVLFSAAIPYQGGEHHINEQWPEYWIRLFHSKTLSENSQIEQNVSAGELNQCQPVLSILRPPSAQAASLGQPRDRTLHYPPPRPMRLLLGAFPFLEIFLLGSPSSSGVDLDMRLIATNADELPYFGSIVGFVGT